MTKNKIVVLGLGNPLFQDEGLGIHMISQLMQQAINERVELVDGGTDALALLNVVEETDHLLVIDAVDGDHPPGTVRKLSGRDIPLLVTGRMSVHQIGFQETLALAALRDRFPQHLVLFGVQPQCLDWGTELSPPVMNALPELTAQVNAQLDDWLA
ncbi:MAG TPA: HyaD/HybD family hydrogenase maturation endopeptidase [Syntrophomonas sp.]|nr:HyaD/HybD family hydrogenase maturation endopeptidase [Syntrophomonas sp.]